MSHYELTKNGELIAGPDVYNAYVVKDYVMRLGANYLLVPMELTATVTLGPYKLTPVVIEHQTPESNYTGVLEHIYTYTDAVRTEEDGIVFYRYAAVERDAVSLKAVTIKALKKTKAKLLSTNLKWNQFVIPATKNNVPTVTLIKEVIAEVEAGKRQTFKLDVFTCDSDGNIDGQTEATIGDLDVLKDLYDSLTERDALVELAFDEVKTLVNEATLKSLQSTNYCRLLISRARR